MTTFGAKVRELRDARGLSVRDLATEIGKSPGYITQIEVRGEIPSAELICRLAAALDGSPEELLGLAKSSQIERISGEIDAKQATALNLFRKGKK